MNNPIKSIELDLGGKKVVLTPEQAKNLKEALDELFGEERIVYREYPIYRRPYYWEWQQPYTNPYPVWTYTTGGITASYSSNTDTLSLTG